MYNLVKNVLRGVKKRLSQYIGIVLLLIIIVATMTGLYCNSERVQAGFATVAKNSVTYDYRIKLNSLNDYKDVNVALIRLKEIIKKQFSDEAEDYQEIIDQVDKITINDIQNNLLPYEGKNINEKLKTYLLNWAINYKAILINDILNIDVKDNEQASNYQFEKSFLKSFDFNQNKKLFYSFEDAFYLDPIPFPELPVPGNSLFDFSPYRNGFNKIYITEGKQPEDINEVVINPVFAKKNNIKLNQEIEFLPSENMKVVGFGYAYWGIVAELSADNLDASPNNTTQVFTTREWMNKYLYDNSGYTSNLAAPFFLKVANKDAFFINKFENVFSNTFSFNYGNLLNADTEDLRSGFLKQNFNMQNIIYSSISFFVMLAAVFIVLSYVRKEIDLQRKQIGLIKALGYNNNEIGFGFTFLIFLISLFSTVVGFALGLPLQARFNNLSDFGFFLPLPNIHFSLIAFLIGVIFVTILFTLVSYLQSYSKLTKNPLFLIYDRQSNVSSKWLAFFKKPFNYWSFRPRLAISFALKSVGKLALIFFTFIFVSFLLLFQSIATDIFDSKINNLYNHVNHDVYYSSKTINMYKFDSQGKISSRIYDWVSEKKLYPEKAITSDFFHIDSPEKLENWVNLWSEDNFKGYYMTSKELNLLYQNTQDPDNPNSDKCKKYIRPEGTNYITENQAESICGGITTFFNYITRYSGMSSNVQQLEPTSLFSQALKTEPQPELPGISLGQIIVNENYYPNLEFSVNNPISWIGHNQGPLLSKINSIISLYNNSDPDNRLAWKSWFNIEEEGGLDIDPVFNSFHRLEQEEVTYIDGFGERKTEMSYIVPAVISKSLAVLNKYKVNDNVLVIINNNNNFIPIILNIRGINVTNLDISNYYVNIDDLRTVLSYVDDDNQPLPGAFNNLYSKDKNFLPLNSINIAQSNNDYSRAGLKNNPTLISRVPLVFPLLKNRLNQMFASIKSIIEISKWLTIIALTFVLIIIVNMILDNNLLIIAMMKALGYRINEINLLIIGSYIFTLFFAFIFGTIMAYITWAIILWIVAKLASTIFILPVSALTIFISFALIFAVITIGYIVGLYFIKFRPVTSLLQSD